MQYGDKLGASDHISFTFSIKYTDNEECEEKPRPNFFKGNYADIKQYLQDVKWEDMSKTDIDKAWSFFTHHVNHCIDNFIPLKNVKKKFNKPKWMDHYCVRKVKKKYHAWKRYTFTRNYRDYEEYCRARNSATKAIRFSKVKHQKGVAESCRDSPKAFWSYVKSETKTKSSVNDLIDSNGNTCSSGEDKARVLNDFFSSVFTKEDEGDLPDFTSKVHANDFVQSVKIDEQKVFKELNQLKTSKACGPDNCHPFFLKTCVNELYKPLCHIFKLSVDSGKIPIDWKNANVTCFFKKGDKANPSNYRPVRIINFCDLQVIGENNKRNFT